MPVKPIIRIIKAGGWKRDKNERFGAVVVGILEAYDAETGKLQVFHFAPDITHCQFLRDLADAVEYVDTRHKEILSKKDELEGKSYQSNGCKE
jgi:hypothetical protein